MRRGWWAQWWAHSGIRIQGRGFLGVVPVCAGQAPGERDGPPVEIRWRSRGRRLAVGLRTLMPPETKQKRMPC
jgi:hypothetical protein